MKPICERCSRNARTVDTPRVKVRVERAVVMRTSSGGLYLIAHCHGCSMGSPLPDGATEDSIEATHVFGDR